MDRCRVCGEHDFLGHPTRVVRDGVVAIEPFDPTEVVGYGQRGLDRPISVIERAGRLASIERHRARGQWLLADSIEVPSEVA